MRDEGGKYWKWVDLEITHVKGSGPGGQNRNKRMSGVRIVHLPTGISVFSTERRSQEQNLSNGLERLDEKLTQLYYRPKPRRATKPTFGSKKRRLEHKTRRSTVKAHRKKSGGWDD